DIAMSGHAQVPDQVALAPTAEDSVAYSLSAAPGMPGTFSGVPDPSQANLVFGAEFTLVDEELRIPVFAYARELFLADKGGEEITDRGLVFKLGTVRSIRALTLLMVLDIQFVLRVQLRVSVRFNPFSD